MPAKYLASPKSWNTSSARSNLPPRWRSPGRRSSVLVTEDLRPGERHLGGRLDRALEVFQLFGEAKYFAGIGLAQTEAQRIVVVGRFAVFRISAAVQGDLEIGGSAPREGAGVKEPRTGGHAECGREKQRQQHLHTSAPDNRRWAAKCVAWQMATAKASEASSDSMSSVNRSSDRTMVWTWRLSARPYPTTLILISSGEYSATARAASATVSKATPLTCASFSAVFTLAEKKIPSTPADSGAYSAISRRSPWAISNRRFSNGHFGLVRMTPATTIRCPSPSASTGKSAPPPA